LGEFQYGVQFMASSGAQQTANNILNGDLGNLLKF
jgi:hypothetical protein